ncbi:hypothetical protein E6H16_07215 [Candidatus Bathyarchaeota archaeon]|nr:MAG: hypothetical protein E6H16_07215 [Candidatus Bathyarchaeota archaeon]
MSKILYLVFTTCLLLIGVSATITTAAAAGETYTLTTTPSRVQETRTGVTLTLNVTNAIFPSPYTFTITVTDPARNNKTLVKSQASTQSSWLITANYPNDFTTNITLVGNYYINVTQTLPVVKPTVATGTFLVGLTDSQAYNRTYIASTRAFGYLPSDNVTIRLTRSGSSTQGFPAWNLTGLDGSFLYKWHIANNTTLGTYNVTLAGKNTPQKNPQDTQTFTIDRTTVTIDSLTITPTIAVRTATVDFRFHASYASGLPVQSGTALVRITDHGTSFFSTASYDPVQGLFTASYKLPLDISAGPISPALDANTIDDSYGNTGPASIKTNTFTVLPAQLAVIASLSKTSYTSSEPVVITATVTTPDGATYNQGSVRASIFNKGQTIGNPFDLTYDQARGAWIGSYNPGPKDPSGTWTITVAASDSYGNSGAASILGIVNIPSASVLDTYSWILPMLVAIIFASAALVLVKRKVASSGVTLDVQAVKKQADQVKSDDFFKSLQSQLEQKTTKWKNKKETQTKDENG